MRKILLRSHIGRWRFCFKKIPVGRKSWKSLKRFRVTIICWRYNYIMSAMHWDHQLDSEGLSFLRTVTHMFLDNNVLYQLHWIIWSYCVGCCFYSTFRDIHCHPLIKSSRPIALDQNTDEDKRGKWRCGRFTNGLQSHFFQSLYYIR